MLELYPHAWLQNKMWPPWEPAMFSLITGSGVSFLWTRKTRSGSFNEYPSPGAFPASGSIC